MNVAVLGGLGMQGKAALVSLLSRDVDVAIDLLPDRWCDQPTGLSNIRGSGQ